MNNGDCTVPTKVLAIESQYLFNAIRHHQRDESSVVNLDPTHTLSNQNIFEYRLRSRSFGHVSELRPNQLDPFSRFFCRQAKAAWPVTSADIPELRKVLQGVQECHALLFQCEDRLTGCRMFVAD